MHVSACIPHLFLLPQIPNSNPKSRPTFIFIHSSFIKTTNKLRQFGISNPLSFSPFKGRGVLHNHSKAYIKRFYPQEVNDKSVLHNHSKAYIKRELNNCKGETQYIPLLSKGRFRRDVKISKYCKNDRAVHSIASE